MQTSRLLLEEPIRLSSILEASSGSKRAYNDECVFSALSKIIGTLGPQSRDVATIEKLLNTGMSVVRFDFSWGDEAYHQETLDNFRTAVRNTRKLCAVMLDTAGPELQIQNKDGRPIVLEADSFLLLTPDTSQEPSSAVLPIENYPELASIVKPQDTIFLGQYLSTGSESTSVWLEVIEVQDMVVKCLVKNSATMSGTLFTAHVCDVRVNLPTLSDSDKRVISTWGVRNSIDFLSLSYTRNGEDVRVARAYLANLGDLYQTQVFAKIETVEGLRNFDEILEEADGIILARGNLGIDVPPEKVFAFQKAVLQRCNLAGKPVIITRVVDSMTDTPRPTRAEATDVANAILDGADGILLGAETLRGMYPVATVLTVRKICAEAEKVFNQAYYFKEIVKAVGEPTMSHLESIAYSAVQAASKVSASAIVVFTSSGRSARLIAKYRPTMPVLVVVIPRLRSNQLRWSFTGAFQARQCLAMRGLFPLLADPGQRADASMSTTESVLKVAIDHGKSAGIIKPHDRVVVCQKVGDSYLVKIIELETY